MKRYRITLVAVLIATSLSAATSPCDGDCNGDGVVRIEELIRLVKAALRLHCPVPLDADQRIDRALDICSPPDDACLQADANGDGAITVNELVSGINRVFVAVRNATQGSP